MATGMMDGIKARIDELLHSRGHHQSAIQMIDSTLERIHSALGSAMPKTFGSGKRRGRPPGSGKKAAAVAPTKGKRRKRGSFTMSGDESVVAFIKGHDGCTTKQVNQHWKGEGRGGSADNALTKLVKLKKLKRTQIKGERGSTYSAT